MTNRASSEPVEPSSEWVRATTLTERARALRATEPLSAPSARALARLRAWREQAPFEDDGWFARRLSSDNLTCDAFARLLDSDVVPASSPRWSASVDEAFARAVPGAPERGLLALVAPLVTRAREALQVAVVDASECADTAAVGASFGRALDSTLLRLVRPTLALELQVARLRDPETHDASRAYSAFVERFADPDAGLAILREYPVLARQLQVHTEAWCSAAAELIRRLVADRPTLIERGLACPERVLVSVDLGRGDTHRGGRSVAVLTWDDGSKLVYKPRSLALDSHFGELMAWVNARDVAPTLRGPRVLDRGTHGWMEFITPRDCGAAEEVERFYARQGALLALVHVLDGVDLHGENVIACGEHPMLIDLEALLHPRAESEPIAGTASTMAASVLRVGLLPQPSVDGLADASGLGAGEGRWHVPMPVWQGVADLRLRREWVPLPRTAHRPVLRGEPVSALAHQQAFCDAFDATMRLLARERGALLAPGGLINRFGEDEVRAILRPTEIYAHLLRETLHPDLLRDAIDRERAFDRLWLGARDQPHLARVVRAEREDLWRGDVPYFTTRASSRDLVTSTGEVIASFFPETAMESVARKLGALDDDERARQRWFVQSALTALASDGDAERLAAKMYEPVLAATAEGEASLVATACALGDRLRTLALRNDGAVEWLGLAFRINRWEIVPAGESLADGNLGIALFLATLGRAAGEPARTRLAEEALASALRGASRGIGAFEGVAGVLYVLAQLTALWGGSVFPDAVGPVLDRIEGAIAEDTDLDVCSGAAGAIPCLLGVARVLRSGRAIDLAVACGDHLLARGERFGEGLAWRTGGAGRRALGGYAHGSSGIGDSLLALAVHTGEPRFAAAARDALVYERSLYSAHERNWRDLRVEGSAHYSMAWCHGAPGIGLARARALRSGHDAVLAAEVEVAVAATRAKGFGASHCLCHGDLGNLELLGVDAERRGDAEALDHARRLASAIAASVRVRPLCGNPHRIETPGLLTGLAGIGYGLLRAADPQRVPSVLTLQPPLEGARR